MSVEQNAASSIDPSHIDAALADKLQTSGLSAMQLGGRRLLPIVQGGMGIGVSAHRLAGSVAAMGGVGTLSAVDLQIGRAHV